MADRQLTHDTQAPAPAVSVVDDDDPIVVAVVHAMRRNALARASMTEEQRQQGAETRRLLIESLRKPKVQQHRVAAVRPCVSRQPSRQGRRRRPGARRVRRVQRARSGPSEPPPAEAEPVDLTRLQAALQPFVCSMELLAELDERELDAFISIASTRLAREASRLCWWEKAA